MTVRERFAYEDMDAIRVGKMGNALNMSFIVYRLGETLIDTGPSNQWKYVRPFVAERKVSQIILTHHHEDHSGNAGVIEKLTGIKPLAPALAIDKLSRGYRMPPIQKFMWGKPGKVDCSLVPEEFTLANGEPVQSIHAPGHAKDMTCYLLPERGWLFSADLYLANKLKMARVDESIPIMLDSIRKVLAVDFDTIICPHRGIVPDGKARLQEKHNYIVNLASQVQEMAQTGMALEDVTSRLLGKEEMMSRVNNLNFSKINLIRSCLDVTL